MTLPDPLPPPPLYFLKSSLTTIFFLATTQTSLSLTLKCSNATYYLLTLTLTLKFSPTHLTLLCTGGIMPPPPINFEALQLQQEDLVWSNLHINLVTRVPTIDNDKDPKNVSKCQQCLS